jgi:hypothetical protein
VVNHYEKELESLKSQERSYLDTIETLQHELESLESANKKLNTALMEEKKRTATADLFSPPANDDVLSGKFAGRMADFLLEENRSLKSGSLKRQYQELFTDSLQRWESHSHQEAERARINKRLNQELGGLIKVYIFVLVYIY